MEDDNSLNIKILNILNNKTIEFPNYEKKDDKFDNDINTDFLFVKVKVKENKKIFLYANDFIKNLKIKIEKIENIPVDCQLLFDNTNKNILGHIIKSDKNIIKIKKISNLKPLNNIEIISTDYNIIGKDIINSNIYILNFSEYIEHKYDVLWLKGLSSYRLNDFWINNIYPYWPSISSNDFINLIKNNIEIKKSNELIDDDLDKIRKIKIIKNKLINIGEYRIINKFITIEYSSNFDIYYIFDKYIPNKKYPICIAKFDENNIYIKKIKNYEYNYIYEYKNSIKKTGIKIGKTLKILPDGKIIYKIEDNDEYDKISKLINIENKIILKNYLYKYFFQIYSDNIININYFIKSFPFSIEKNYKNNKNSISFYYKKVSQNISNKKYYSNNIKIQIGALIDIVQNGNINNITVSNINNNEDMNNIYNFLSKVFYIYNLETKNKNSKVNIKNSTNLKTVDPKLFNITRNNKKIYSRICQKNKQPIAFFKNSNVLKKYLSNNENIKYLEYKNTTYKDKKSIFICPNKNYPNVTFFKNIRHDDGHCIPCCSKKDKSGNLFFKECIEKINIKDKLLDEKKQLTNLFYIRKYNSFKKIEDKKFSFLPNILDDFINKYNINCKINFNIVALNKSCYILIGNDSLKTNYTNEFIVNNKINIIIFDYDNKSNKINIINNFSNESNIYRLNTMKTKFLFKDSEKDVYNEICKISSIKYKNYDISNIFDSNSLICKKMVKLFNLKIKYEKNESEIMKTIERYNIEIKNVKQIINNKQNYVNSLVFNDEIKIPIIPSLPIEKIETIKTFKINNKKIVDKYIKKNCIEKYLFEKTNKFIIGYELKNNKLMIFFEPEKINKNFNYKNKKIIYYSIDKESFNDKNILIEIELYYLYFYNISYWLNNPEIKYNENIKISDLENEYFNNKKDKRFVEDYSLLISKKNENIKKMNYWKKHKNMIINNNKKTLDILYDLTKNKIIFSDYNEIEIKSNIREKMSKMKIPEKLYHKYTKLISYEIDNNDIKKYKLLNQKVSRIIDKNNFSKQPGIDIIKI
jgi:hypothetical protein